GCVVSDDPRDDDKPGAARSRGQPEPYESVVAEEVDGVDHPLVRTTGRGAEDHLLGPEGDVDGAVEPRPGDGEGAEGCGHVCTQAFAGKEHDLTQEAGGGPVDGCGVDLLG